MPVALLTTAPPTAGRLLSRRRAGPVVLCLWFLGMDSRGACWCGPDCGPWHHEAPTVFLSALRDLVLKFAYDLALALAVALLVRLMFGP